ncbi:RNA-binding protein 4, partial [Plakobranchus ocellatus]
HFEKESEAKTAVEALDGHIHRGSNIRVEVSRSRVRQKAGMGGKGECYRCGAEGHWSRECPRGPSRGRSGGSHRDRGADRYNPYDRDPYYSLPPDPYDYYARARAFPPYPYDRYRLDYEYERRLAALPPLPRESLYRDFTDRPGPEYYRRPSPTRDPYYDFYERRRLAALDPYGDKIRTSSATATRSSDNYEPVSRLPMQSRVPGPY